MNYWIFQSRPDRFDLREKIKPGTVGFWEANQHRADMAPDDFVYFWMSGAPDTRGIYGWGKLTSTFYFNPEWDKNAVNVQYGKVVNPPLLIDKIKSILELQKLSIIRMPSSTNFRITLEEAEAIAKLISPDQRPNLRLSLSSTVSNAINTYGPNDEISTATLAEVILSQSNHRTEYASGRLSDRHLEDTPEKFTTPEWLDKLQSLFDPNSVPSASDPDVKLLLDGRLMIIGLGLLDKELYQQLKPFGAYKQVIDELRPELEHILSAKGRALFDERIGIGFFNTVHNWSDDPLFDPEDDKLGREAFARFLKERIEFISSDSEESAAEQGAYAMHVHGPWGAGKSTLLNFLICNLAPYHRQDEKNDEKRVRCFFLRLWYRASQLLLGKPQRVSKVAADDDQWLIVEFNAWRNQHIEPPWWSLMESVFQVAKDKLSCWNLIKEYWWRLTTGRVVYIVSAVVMFWLVAWALSWVNQDISGSRSDIDFLKSVADIAEYISAVLALIATVWGGILAINRSFLLGSANAAKTYKERIHDPMNEVKSRFNDLIISLQPKKVIIIIDDLDRCQSRYVVELLEGIQTLFREAPVVYVVAADRRWLNACYMREYEMIESQIRDPGQPLGIYFLEKAFRFSTPMPSVSKDLKQQYWQHLLQLSLENDENEVINPNKRRQEIQQLVSQAESEDEFQYMLQSSQTSSFIEQQIAREEIAVRLATPKVTKRLEHELRPYAGLLKPNPRAMKRFVNAYSANKALVTLSRIEIDRHQLVLWTIINERWPVLAYFLEDYPFMVNHIPLNQSAAVLNDGPKQVVEASRLVQQDEDLNTLFDADEVASVVRPEARLKAIFNQVDITSLIRVGPLGVDLHEQTIKRCAEMHA